MISGFWKWVISLIITLGVIKAVLLPIILPSVFGATWMDGKGLIVNLVLHIPVLLGFVYFLVRKGSFKRKEFSIWGIIGIFMVGISILPFIQRVYVGSFFTDPLDLILYEIRSMSEVSFYGIGFGLWIAFFDLENRKELLLFLIPLSLAWMIGFLPFSLLYHLRFTSFGLGYGIDESNLMLPYGFRLWIFPKCMWNMWFWTELFVRYPLAVFVLIRVFNVYVKNMKFMQSKKSLSYG